MLEYFLGQTFLVDIIRVRVFSTSDVNSILLHLSLGKILFIVDCVYSFGTPKDIIKRFTSKMGGKRIHHAISYGELIT